MENSLPETLRRLREHAGDRDLNSQELAAKTAVPEVIVQALLRGEDPPVGKVEERVCSRIARLADDFVVRTGKRTSDLISEVAAELGISENWARLLLKGDKMPNVKLLHGLAAFFSVEGGEAFFTATPAEALNRVLLPVLDKYEDPSSDPVQALLRLHGVKATDLRHGGTVTPEALEVLLESVIKSVLPPVEGDAQR